LYKVSKKDLPPVNIAENIYGIWEPSFVRSSLVVGNEKALLFDTGSGIWNMKRAAERITDRPITVVNSHGHIDHTGGNFLFDEVHIHREDMKVKELHSTEEFKFRFIHKYLDHEIKFPDEYDEEEYMNRKDCTKCLAVEEGRIFNLGGIALEVIHLLGHTAGCIALYDRKNEFLISGDSISPEVWLYLDESTDISAYADSLHKLKKLKISHILASHETGLLGPDLIDCLIRCTSAMDRDKCSIFSNPFIPYEGLKHTETGIYEERDVSVIFKK
jgi:glyoxylase-like metal-dependent hydrolase (beta-lactamase superfamily II)